MSGGGGSGQTVVQSQQIPAWMEEPIKQNIQMAQDIAARPYQAYPGQTVAGFAPETAQAFDYAKSGIGYALPAYAQAQQAAAGLTGYQPQQVAAQNFLQGDISAYMNPFTQSVVDASLANLKGATQMALNQNAADAIRARAFGGSRQGITEGVTQAQAAKSAGELSANLYSQAFDKAAQLMQADQARNLQAQQLNQAAGLQGAGLGLQAAQQLGALGAAGQQSIAQDVSTLQNIGLQLQAQQQAQLDAAYQQYLEELNYPIQALNLRIGATSSAPVPMSQTQTGGGSGSSFLSGLGALGTLASGIGSLAGGFKWSDKTMKTDIEKVGKDKETGLNMYAYRYKGDPKTYPKVVGPMAQDIEKKYPQAVKKIAGKKAVNLGFGPIRNVMGG
jgi:hypothetical protein